MQPGPAGPAGAPGNATEAASAHGGLGGEPPCPGAGLPVPVPGGPDMEQCQACAVEGGQPAGSPLRVMPPPPARLHTTPAPPPAGFGASSLASSSQRDSLTGHLALVLTSEAGTEERDEYLLRLLRKGAARPPASAAASQGAPPAAQHQSLSPQQQQPGLAGGQPQPQPSAPTAQEAACFRAPSPMRRTAAAGAAAGPATGPGPPASMPPTSPARPSRRTLPRQASSSLATPSGGGTTAGATVPSLAASQPTGITTASGGDLAVPASHFTPPAAQPPRAKAALEGAGGSGGSGGAGSGNAAAAAAGAATPLIGEAALLGSFAVTRQRLGDEMAFSVRNTMIRQQVMFLEQLFDLHRAIAIQKLLMQNCPEVQQVMGEAMRLMSSVGSQHGSGSGRASKRGQRTTPNGGATVPGSGSGDPSSFRPDSQFAAVPQLPGEVQTAGVSGDDEDGGSGDGNGSGSGQNGSGGGSTSPQHQRAPPPARPLPYMYLAHTAVATPSGASAAPNAAWQWGLAPLPGAGAQQEQQQAAPPPARALPPVPRGPPQMPPWVGQDAGLAAVGTSARPPAHAAAAPAAAPPAAAARRTSASGAAAAAAAPAPAEAAAPPAPSAAPAPAPHMSPLLSGAGYGMGGMPGMMAVPPGLAGGTADPLSWWYQNYYGSAAAAASFQQAQQAQQAGGMSLANAQAAAAAAAALMPPPPPCQGGASQPHNTAGGGTGTGLPTATATQWWHDPALAFGPAADPDILTRRRGGDTTTATAATGREVPEVQSAPAGKRGADAGGGGVPTLPSRRASLYSEGRGHLKRKAAAAAAADADEASSGTTGHALGHPGDACAVSPRSGFKRQETMRARSARGARSAPRGGAAPPPGSLPPQDESAAALLLSIGANK